MLEGARPQLLRIIRELFLAVVRQGAAGISEAREPRPDLSLEERVAVSVAADLDIYEANRETFFAVMGHTTWSSDPAIDALPAPPPHGTSSALWKIRKGSSTTRWPPGRHSARCWRYPTRSPAAGSTAT